MSGRPETRQTRATETPIKSYMQIPRVRSILGRPNPGNSRIFDLRKIFRPRNSKVWGAPGAPGGLLGPAGLDSGLLGAPGLDFGFLLVLDLTDRNGHQQHISERITIERKTPVGSDTEYLIVVARVQALRKTPHDLK